MGKKISCYIEQENVVGEKSLSQKLAFQCTPTAAQAVKTDGYRISLETIFKAYLKMERGKGK